MAMDRAWWDMYLDDVKSTFAGARFTVNKLRDVQQVPPPFVSYGNSGGAAIAFADKAGAAKVILLGFDCQHTDGKAHHHGDHPRKLGNAGSVTKWLPQFEKLAKSVKCDVINASRVTALESFKRQDLDLALE